jgi:porphobilinogen synthase
MKEVQHYTYNMENYTRFRPLRKDITTRDSLAEVHLLKDNLILPFFIVEGNNIKHEISSLPGVFHLSSDTFIEELDAIVRLGINKILLFGVVEDYRKDETGSFSASPDNPVNVSIRKIKTKYPDLTVITDICLCAYTSHGHCGILQSDLVDNDSTLPLLAQMALENARAGVDIVAPSAMMDGQVWAIRKLLDHFGFQQVKILSYSAKYSSGFYGPFRGAANSKPSFGDRKTYQMDYRVASQALEEMTADIQEGAEFLMVKPAHTYLDIIRQAKSSFPNVLLAAYHVSGEYMMVKAAAQAGVLNEEQTALEILTAIRRAGADWIITYFSPQIAKILSS